MTKNIKEVMKRLLKDEKDKSIESYWWMSFCDDNKPRGEQFLGVIITKSFGLCNAIKKTHDMNINPGGKVQIIKLVENINDIIDIDNLLDRLLTKDEVKEIIKHVIK